MKTKIIALITASLMAGTIMGRASSCCCDSDDDKKHVKPHPTHHKCEAPHPKPRADHCKGDDSGKKAERKKSEQDCCHKQPTTTSKKSTGCCCKGHSEETTGCNCQKHTNHLDDDEGINPNEQGHANEDGKTGQDAFQVNAPPKSQKTASTYKTETNIEADIEAAYHPNQSDGSDGTNPEGQGTTSGLKHPRKASSQATPSFKSQKRVPAAETDAELAAEIEAAYQPPTNN